ncbi:MAG: BON domain-containing protein [Pyrinomonadaceae bacterium]|nr:BON domain-containing protein [Pyrinomonadaceae bacterium]
MSLLKNNNLVLVIALMLAFTGAAPAKAGAQALSHQQLAKKVRQELVTLPLYGVFDNLAYQIEGGTVTLYGQVVKPVTRKDAERRIAKLPGVKTLVNNIEVLPLSNFDDELRVRTYRAVFSSGGLYRYGRGVNPSIHIVINRGHVTLEGVVANEADSQIANLAARSVPGVFSVTNNLRAESSERRAR